MKTIFTFFTLFLSTVTYSQFLHGNDSIAKFVSFLTNQNLLTPKEYIFKSFEKNDIIIISERHHAELKQYELIIDVLKDERFKGNIYTEAGVFNSHKSINNFLKKERLSKEEKEIELLNIYRSIDYEIVWDKYNYYYLISSIYDINQNRKDKDKILLYPLDVVFSWDSIKCSEQYNMFQEMMESSIIPRNTIMGLHFIDAYELSKSSNSNKNKALVILNTYHGYTRIPTYLPLPTEPSVYSTAEYIYKTYPNTTKGLLINGFILDPKTLVANGKWDAAFKVYGNKNIGFDLKNTPFGSTIFDMYNFGGSDYAPISFENIFDGFIFYYPINDFEIALGIPNIYNNNETLNEFYYKIAIEKNITIDEAKKSKEIQKYLKEINLLKVAKIEDLDRLESELNKWLVK